MDLISEFSNRLYNNKKSVFIHVIGDSMVDEDYRIQANRISPECPNVNILLSPDDKPANKFPGGAANVCYQLSNFNVICRLFSFVDEEAYQVIRSRGVKFWGKIDLPQGHFVPRKKRYYAEGYQVVTRWDIERQNYGLECLQTLQNELLTTWSAFRAEPDVIVFSDYNKGLFNDFGISGFKTNAMTIIDPKTTPLERWKGCSIFKPNSKEALALSGKSNWKEQCDYFKEILDCKAVVITQEGNGVVGKTDEYFEYRPKLHVHPVDIVGAGDCFAGILALATALDFNVEEAAIIAFHGGSICVQQKERGNFGPWSFGSKCKIINNLEFLVNRNFKLVVTNGCFDVLHVGHLHSLEYAKSKGDKLLVMVNSDESVRALKGEKRPIVSLEDRMKMLAALECVDYVIGFNHDTPVELIKKVRPDVLVKGADWQGKEVAGAEYASEMCYVSTIAGYSTSQIVQKLTS